MAATQHKPITSGMGKSGSFSDPLFPESLSKAFTGRRRFLHDSPNSLVSFHEPLPGVVFVSKFRQDIPNPCAPSQNSQGTLAWLKEGLGHCGADDTSLAPAETIQQAAQRFEAHMRERMVETVEYVDVDIPVNYEGANW